jgi:decaprenylphospho-beta-D-erythro-pentofuranosid-2-ulose 2-reductase
VLISHGSLPDQALCERNFDAAIEAFNINALSVISLLSYIVKPMQERRKGCIAVVTSVAGDRGRQSNFIYGAAKAMVSTYLQGLRGRLFPHNVAVVDIKPGFVDSPMTAHLPKGALWAQPEQIAQRIVRAVEKKRTTIYAPGFWRLIMIIVCSVPEFIFKRLKL